MPAEGTYIDALNEAGVHPQRIEQMQNSKLLEFELNPLDVNAEEAQLNDAAADEFNIWREYS